MEAEVIFIIICCMFFIISLTVFIITCYDSYKKSKIEAEENNIWNQQGWDKTNE